MLLSHSSSEGPHTHAGLWEAEDASKPCSLVNNNEANTELIKSSLKEVDMWEILQHMTICHLVSSAS